jgi:putative transposase
MSAEDVKELRRLREENRRLKQMVADCDLDIEMLKEVARGNF